MTEKDIHNLIEQEEAELKQRIWERIKPQLDLEPSPKQQLTLFTYVNTGNGYVKQPITLFELIARLSDKRVDAPENLKQKYHSNE